MSNMWNKIHNKLKDPTFMRHFHAYMTILWFVLIIPTVLFWANSVLWVALISCYANAVGHFSSYQATRAEES